MIKTLINRVLIVLTAFFRHKKVKNENKNVLIVFSQIYGDAILFSGALNHYAEIYKKADGYRVTILLRPNIHKFLDELFDVHEDIDIEDVDFTRFLNDYKYYKSCIRKFEGHYSTLIVPVTTLSAEVFSKSNDAIRKVGLIRANYIKKPLYRAYFNRYSYTEKVHSRKEDMILQCHAQLLNYLCGNKDQFEAEMPCVSALKKVEKENHEHYCVIAIGSSMPEKQWPIERFAKVADYIAQQSDINIHLCGIIKDRELENIFYNKIGEQTKQRIVSNIGNTSYLEWANLIRNAEFLVGNDSASAHLAAAVGTKAVVIVGVYEKNRFFPYSVQNNKVKDCQEYDEVLLRKEESNEETDSASLPSALLYDMPCAWCKTRDFKFGHGNNECRNRIRNKKCCLCVDKVTVTNVEQKVSDFLKI